MTIRITQKHPASKKIINIVRKNKITNRTNAAVDGGRSFAVGTNTALSGWNDGDSSTYYLTITVTTDGADSIYGGTITMR